jgi:predicted sulfurtransferase
MRYYISLTAILIVGISIFTACEKPAPPVNISKANSASHTEEHADNAPRIALADAKRAFDEGGVVFIDTRPEVAFQQEHVKGAINIPAESFPARFAEVPKDKKIIAYCS